MIIIKLQIRKASPQRTHSHFSERLSDAPMATQPRPVQPKVWLFPSRLAGQMPWSPQPKAPCSSTVPSPGSCSEAPAAQTNRLLRHPQSPPRLPTANTQGPHYLVTSLSCLRPLHTLPSALNALSLPSSNNSYSTSRAQLKRQPLPSS